MSVPAASGRSVLSTRCHPLGRYLLYIMPPPTKTALSSTSGIRSELFMTFLIRGHHEQRAYESPPGLLLPRRGDSRIHQDSSLRAPEPRPTRCWRCSGGKRAAWSGDPRSATLF